ncbi:hypothetical protein CHS0354_004032 [Potamilus streckersoni]|nr:hypothetical protein CHS0354_004032 [Potamilus streckersoni]
MQIHEEESVVPLKDRVDSSNTPVSSIDNYANPIDFDDDLVMIEAADMDSDSQSSFNSDVIVLDSIPNVGHIGSSHTADLTQLDHKTQTDGQSQIFFAEVQSQSSSSTTINAQTSASKLTSVLSQSQSQTSSSQLTGVLSQSQSTAQQSSSILNANHTGSSLCRPLGPSQLVCFSPSTLTFSPNIGSVMLTPLPGLPTSSHYYFDIGNIRPEMTISAIDPSVTGSSQNHFHNKVSQNTGQPQVLSQPKVNTSVKSLPRLLSKTSIQHRISNQHSFSLGPLPSLTPFSASPLSAPQPENVIKPGRRISQTEQIHKGAQNEQQPGVFKHIFQGDSSVNNGTDCLGASAVDAVNKTLVAEKTLGEKLVIPEDNAVRSKATAATDMGQRPHTKPAVGLIAVNNTVITTSTASAVAATAVPTTVTVVTQQALNASNVAITTAVKQIATTVPKTVRTAGEIGVQNQTSLVGTSGGVTAARQIVHDGITANHTSFCAVTNVAKKLGQKHVIIGAVGSKSDVQPGHSFPTSATGALPDPKNGPLPTANNPAMQPSLVKDNPLRPQITQQTVPTNIPAILTTTAVSAPKDPHEGILQEVLVMFPDVDPSYVLEFLRGQQNGFLLNAVCNYLLETNYPKVKNSTEGLCTTEMPTIDYYRDFKSIDNHLNKNYIWQCTELLTTEFKWVAASNIQQVMKLFQFCYAPSHKALKQVWKTAMEKIPAGQSPSGFRFTADIETENHQTRITFRLLKNSRKSRIISSLDPQLQREVDFVRLKNLEELEEMDYQLALKMNENEYEELGQQIECGCCYGEFAFESLVQCYDGHLFCGDCLQKYAEESVFGQGKAELSCMTDSCKATFPLSQLMKVLPSNIISRYEDRIQEENINLADLEDLVRCPFCDFAALLDSAYAVFSCQNSSCMKDSCRHCQVEWSEHFGKKCSDIEKKDETKLRLEFEEKMTLAKIRVCHKCKAKFTKIDGCNKMTCRCGAKICYICRKPDIDYNHFCRHPRDPGMSCNKCQNCSLWTNPDEDDDRAVKEIQLEANKIRKEKGFLEEKLIGAPEEPPLKKTKTNEMES